MALGPGGTIYEWTFSSLSSSPGEGLRFPTYDVQRGGPRSSGGWSWCSVEPSPLPGMAGCSRFGLVTGNESRTLVWHVVPGSGYDGGNATTQRRLSNADELGHFRPVRVGTTRDGLECITKYNWRRPIPESGSDGRSTGHARTSSFGPHGGIRTMETLIGPIAVRDGTILRPAFGVYAVKIWTIYDIFYFLCYNIWLMLEIRWDRTPGR